MGSGPAGIFVFSAAERGNKEIKIKSPAQIGLEAKQIGKKEGRRERLKILADMSQHSHLVLFFCKPKVKKSRS